MSNPEVKHVIQITEMDSLPAPIVSSPSAPLAQDMIEEDHEMNLQVDESKLQQSTSRCAKVSCVIGCPFALLCGFFTVSPNEEVVQTNCGVYTEKIQEPGCHWTNPCGRTTWRISTRQVSIDLPTIKVLDSNGNPLMMSAILVYKYTNTARAVFAVQDADTYIRNQATATLRKVISTYPYETADSSPSLKTHLSQVSRDLGAAAVSQLAPAGVAVIAFQVNEISYAPEIAQAMLKKQAATALVQAREVLVRGCTEIARDAVRMLQDSGITMTDDEAVGIVSNVLTVTCSDAATVNTIPVGNPSKRSNNYHTGGQSGAIRQVDL